MRYILLFIAIFTFSCKYNISSPVGTIKDYSANSGKLFYTSSDSSADDIETTLKKNKHSLGIYKIVVSGGDSTAILTNIKKVLDKNPSFDNVGIDLSLTKITNIPKEMFTNTTNLGKITLPDTVTNIEESAFLGCSSLSYIRFSGGLTNIGTNAFSNCSALTVLLLPDGLKTIEKCAFSDCSYLVNLFLPKSLTKIDNDAFKNCSQLKNVEYLGETNSLSNCSPFSNGGTNPSNLYLPNVDTSKTNDFTNFLGKNWNGNIHAKKHIPS
ncbi:leucine-rich repeat domain-containing protein [Brachyspira aalborgi]|uniref:Leucine-rich repeat domain-containing protein n=1 Tax=Brachyspira aalborgi TaxID=29522 RepID=A0A5C8GHJ9_9SPIR|nr:leucine-rich repeat domain-containing protein [Brachyspira aalborgi]TXJ61397.1 leucine-rich repeat domain-containing protein [Brachyspira aalborgi]